MNKSNGAAQLQLGGENPPWLNHIEEIVGSAIALHSMAEAAQLRSENPRLSDAHRAEARREMDEHQEALKLLLFDLGHDAESAKCLLSLETMRESRHWPKTERTVAGLRQAARLSLQSLLIVEQQKQSGLAVTSNQAA